MDELLSFITSRRGQLSIKPDQRGGFEAEARWPLDELRVFRENAHGVTAESAIAVLECKLQGVL